MAKAVRYKVRCTVCHEVFQNDYVGRHSKSKHKDLHASGRLAPITIELDKSDTRQSKMDAFFCSTTADESNPSSAKKRKTATTIEVTKLSEPEEGDDHESTTDNRESSTQKEPILTEQREKEDTTEECTGTSSEREMSDHSDDESDDEDPAGLGDMMSIDKSDGQSSGKPDSSKLATHLSGPNDISLTKDDQPVQPRRIKFPSHVIGRQYRSFNPSLYDKYLWLEYSECEDAVYCFHCRHFSTERKEQTFVTNGMRNWKRCYGTKPDDNKLLQHHTSFQHAESVAAHAHYQDIKSGKFHSVAELQDAEHSKQIKNNRHYLRTVAEILLLTAQRKIAQRETGRSFRVKDIIRKSLTFGQSCGNFLAILSVVAKHDPVIAERIRYGPANAKYTHHTIQNALLDIMKDMTLEQIQEEVRKAVYFTVLADESKDTGKKEQVVVAVRYCLNNGIHEEFVGIAEAQSLDADGLTDTIISQLRRIDANMKNCVGQGYDGASVVAGRLNGVQKKLREKTSSEMAYYVHCYCHRLNLVIVDVVNSIPCVANMIALIKKIHSFLGTSTVHVRWEKAQEIRGLRKMEIGNISDTRWACQAKQLNAMAKRIEVVHEVLKEIIQNDTDADRIVDAKGFKLQMDRHFVRYLLVIRHILKKAKFASDMLQKPTNDLSNAIDLIAVLKEALDACRSREKCQQFWDEAEDVANRLNLPDDIRPVRNRRPPAALEDFFVESNIEENLGLEGFDAFVRDVFEIVDKVNAELRRRFDQNNIVMMQGVTSLCPSSSSFLDEDSLVAFGKLFNVNTDCLSCEIATFHHLLKRKDKKDHPKGLLQMLSYLETLKEAFSELHRIVLIACTLPVSSAECERNFSSMKLIKNELRSVMKQERLDSLMMLGIHSERGERLDLDSVVDRFKARFPKCRISL